MSGTVPRIPPPLGTGTSGLSNSNVNRVDTMPNTKTTNDSPTINVSRSVDGDLLLPQLLDSRGGSHITNVPTFDKDDFTNGPFVPMSNLSTPANPLPKCQNQWSNAESRLANQDKRLKSISIGCLPNDVMKSVIKYKTAKEMWTELCLAYKGPSDTRDTKIAALRLKFNAFKALEGEKVNDHNLWDIIVDGDLQKEATPAGEQSGPPAPKTAKQLTAKRNQERVKRILLLAIPDEYLLKFHNVLDAKSLWAAIKSSLDKAYDRFQQLISQLEVHAATVSKEDINQKFLRSLPPSWSQIALIMRNKPDIDQTDIDDLYNNLRVYEDEMKRSSSSTSNSQNLAFLSSENTSSADEVVCSFFAQQTTSPPLDNEDLQQIDQDDLEELDIRWQVAMLTVRECKSGRNQGKRSYGDNGRRNATTNEPSSQALVAQDGLGGYDWSNDFDEPVNYALMAISSSSSSSSSDNEDQVMKDITLQMIGLDEYAIRKKIIESQTIELNTNTGKSKTSESVDCDFYDKKSPEPKLKTMVNTGQRVVKPVWDNAKRVNQQKNLHNFEYPQAIRAFVPSGVLTRTCLVNPVRPNEIRAVHTFSTARPINTARPVSTARQFAPKIAQTSSAIRPIYPRMDNVRPRVSYSPIKRSYYTKPTFRPKDLKQDVKPSGSKNMTTAGQAAVVNMGNPESILQEHSVVDSGFFSHMTGNKAYLLDYKDYNELYDFGSDPKGGKITGKGKIRTANLDFDDVYFVDESQVVLRAPRQNGVYSLDLKNIVPSGGKPPSISFMRPFGCLLTILNTLDPLGKFDGKSDEGYLLGYSTSNQPNVSGTGPNWMFDLDFFTNSMNYIPVSVENQVNVDAGIQDSYVTGSSGKDKGPTQEYILLPLQPHRTRIPVEDVVPAAHEKPSKSSPKDNDVQDSEDVGDKVGQHQMAEDEQVLHDELKKMIVQEVVAKSLDDAIRQAFEEEKKNIASQKRTTQATSTNKLSTVNTATMPYVSAASTPTGANVDESSFVYLG
ncbi:hypothetical protein Tco_0439728 [Tanacetum coccineum]